MQVPCGGGGVRASKGTATQLPNNCHVAASKNPVHVANHSGVSSGGALLRFDAKRLREFLVLALECPIGAEMMALAKETIFPWADGLYDIVKARNYQREPAPEVIAVVHEPYIANLEARADVLAFFSCIPSPTVRGARGGDEARECAGLRRGELPRAAPVPSVRNQPRPALVFAMTS